MYEPTAQAIRDKMECGAAVDWAGGMFGVEIETEHVTTEGNIIELWIGSDTDGRVIFSFGTQEHGPIIEMPTAISDNEHNKVAAFALVILATHVAFPDTI